MRRFIIWTRVAMVLQFLTALIHATNFVVEQAPANDTEKQLLDLMTTYKMDAGAGYHPTFMGLFHSMSISFDLLLIFGGVLNAFFLKKQLSNSHWKGFLLIQVIIFGLTFVIMVFLTFLPPIACTGLIFLSLLIAYFTVPTTKTPPA